MIILGSLYAPVLEKTSIVIKHLPRCRRPATCKVLPGEYGPTGPLYAHSSGRGNHQAHASFCRLSNVDFQSQYPFSFYHCRLKVEQSGSSSDTFLHDTSAGIAATTAFYNHLEVGMGRQIKAFRSALGRIPIVGINVAGAATTITIIFAGELATTFKVEKL